MVVEENDSSDIRFCTIHLDPGTVGRYIHQINRNRTWFHRKTKKKKQKKKEKSFFMFGERDERCLWNEQSQGLL